MEFLDPPFIIAILVALSVHEWAHAAVATFLGDPTARREGRLTLNPIAHLDLLGTILFLVARFGWGKPVPVDPRYFRHPLRDTALVSIAGPVSNLILALLCGALLIAIAPDVMRTSLLTFSGSINAASIRLFLLQTLSASLFLNLGLMAFNLLPIAPLDGSKVLGAFIPLRHQDAYDRFLAHGPFILLALLLAERLFNIPLLYTWIVTIISPILWLLAGMGG